MKYLQLKLTFILIFAFSFCFSQSLFIINEEPFMLEGKWEFITQLKESGQYHLENKKKKLDVLISVRKQEVFEFYDKSLSEKELVDRFYKWETDYWLQENGVKAEIFEIKKDNENNFIIWQLVIKDESASSKIDSNYFLYFVRNNKLISIGLNQKNDKKQMTEIEVIKFLEEIYFKKES